VGEFQLAECNILLQQMTFEIGEIRCVLDAVRLQLMKRVTFVELFLSLRKFTLDCGNFPVIRTPALTEVPMNDNRSCAEIICSHVPCNTSH
jgi:hypothetical protein